MKKRCTGGLFREEDLSLPIVKQIDAMMARAKERVSLDHVVRSRVFVVSMGDLEEVGLAIAEHFRTALPAATGVEVSRLSFAGQRVEIELEGPAEACERQLTRQGHPLEDTFAYSRAVAAPPWLAVAGTTVMNDSGEMDLPQQKRRIQEIVDEVRSQASPRAQPFYVRDWMCNPADGQGSNSTVVGCTSLIEERLLVESEFDYYDGDVVTTQEGRWGIAQTVDFALARTQLDKAEAPASAIAEITTTMRGQDWTPESVRVLAAEHDASYLHAELPTLFVGHTGAQTVIELVCVRGS